MKKLQWGKGLVPSMFGWMRWSALAIVGTGTPHAAGLNDTGITDSYNDTPVATCVERDIPKGVKAIYDHDC